MNITELNQYCLQHNKRIETTAFRKDYGELRFQCTVLHGFGAETWR